MANSNDLTGTRGRTTKRGRFGALLEEWFFQLVLVAAVVAALVESAARLNGSSIV
jgi:hypothetical protein